ncbi:MAG: hypothetical protein FWF60_07155 [Oscillospiraceae bacterium]|nr:hypothetical protein [Oscillospiraceae bacterium]
MNKKILPGVAALLLLAAGIMIGLRLGSSRGGEPPAQGATESRGTAPAAADGYEEAIEAFFEAFQRGDVEKLLDLMVIETRLGAFPSERQALRKQLEAGYRGMRVIEATYQITSVERDGASDFYPSLGWAIPPETEELVLVEGIASIRSTVESFSEECPLLLLNVSGRWYIIPDFM